MVQKVISKSILNVWLQIGHQQGLNVFNCIQNLNISLESEFVPFEKFCLFIEWMVQKSNNELLGLQVGTQLNLAVLGIVGQIIQSCQTLEEGINKACENFNIISNAVKFKILKNNTSVVLIFEIEETFKNKFPIAVTQLSMASLVFAYKEIRFLTLNKHYPIWVKTTSANINHRQSIAEVFETEIEMRSLKNSMAFDKKVLTERILYSDFELLVDLENLICKRYAHQIQNTESFTDTIKSIVYTLIDPTFPSLAAISRQVNMSERSLQRRLKKEGYSYSTLLTEIKKSMALECLDKKMTIKEISYLLGYSESSAFVNAFKNWFGTSPSKYLTDN